MNNATGEIIPIPGWPIRLAPDCLYCDGSSYEPGQYPELFAAIGYKFGQDGERFKVPDMNVDVHRWVIRAYAGGFQ